MSTPKPPPPSARRDALIRRADQWTIGVLVGLAIAAQGIYWALQWGTAGPVHIDRVDRLDPMYRVDINEARWPEFAQLPTVGETLAKRIVAYRETHGSFAAHGELERVAGIGSATLQKIEPYLLEIE